MFQCFTLSQVEEIDICLSCNLLRLRTCADTILVLTEVADNVARLSAAASVASAAAPASSSSSRLSENQSTDQDPQQVPDEVLPDLEDAMAELEVEAAANTAAAAASKKAKPRRRGGDKGAQVFFFPNEGGNVKINLENEEDEDEVHDCMTQSVYLQQSTGANNSSDDSLEESFFFVESVGTGTVGGSGEPTVRPLDDVVIVYDNHFAIPQKSINFLKTPKGFAR